VEVWQGVEIKEPSYFITKENQERLARAREKNLVQVNSSLALRCTRKHYKKFLQSP